MWRSSGSTPTSSGWQSFSLYVLWGVREAHFIRLYPQSRSFGHYPNSVTIGEGRNDDRPVNPGGDRCTYFKTGVANPVLLIQFPSHSGFGLRLFFHISRPLDSFPSAHNHFRVSLLCGTVSGSYDREVKDWGTSVMCQQTVLRSCLPSFFILVILHKVVPTNLCRSLPFHRC